MMAMPTVQGARFLKGYGGLSYVVPMRSTKTGRDFNVRIKSKYVPNPSVRGGAYATRWIAEFGSMRASADTRIDALRQIVFMMIERGVEWEWQ